MNKSFALGRFWHSSAAYAIATEAGCGDVSTIPPEGHDIYKWPQDLLKPDVSFILQCLVMCMATDKLESVYV